MDGYLYLAKNLAGDKPEVVSKLSHIEQISGRAAGMIKQLLIFSRKDSARKKKLKLGPYVKSALELIRASVPENIVFHQDICNEILEINGDGSQIHQVLMNLVNNSRDAVYGVADPCITIALDAFQTDDEFMGCHPGFTAGRYAHLSVKDNGCGIPDHQTEHLFEPFFTTKNVGKGTGLGLAMVYGAVKNHDGFISIESAEGKGSLTDIYMPLLESDEIAPVSPQEETLAEGHSELILVADDEPDIRETTAEVLKSMGYNVLQARDGLEVIEIFKAHQDEIVLAILDIVMPHLGGTELAKRIRQLNPHLPVIFMTGYDKEQVFDRSEGMPDCAILTKPWGFSDLSQKIRELLDATTVDAAKNVVNLRT